MTPPGLCDLPCCTHQGRGAASVCPSPRFREDPSLLGDCHHKGCAPTARLRKQGFWKPSCFSAGWLLKGAQEEHGHQSPGRFATSAFTCCAGLSWNIPLWACSNHSSSPKKNPPTALGRLSLFRETVAPHWGGKTLLHWR